MNPERIAQLASLLIRDARRVLAENPAAEFVKLDDGDALLIVATGELAERIKRLLAD